MTSRRAALELWCTRTRRWTVLKDALVVAREKVQAKIDAKATYEAAMRGAV